MEIEEFVLKGWLAAGAPYIISNIIYNRKNLSNWNSIGAESFELKFILFIYM